MTVVKVAEERFFRINPSFQPPACRHRPQQQSFTAADCTEVCYAEKVHSGFSFM